jgi:hypothetical protein
MAKEQKDGLRLSGRFTKAVEYARELQTEFRHLTASAPLYTNWRTAISATQ